jgi:hypothetical protein
MKELGTIEQEAEDCRAAFANSKVGDAVWLCHHEVLCEPLSELPENRISYILSSKSRNEQARRLREFRPVRGKLPAELDKAGAEWDKASAECMPQLMALHAEECPDSVWDGQSLF